MSEQLREFARELATLTGKEVGQCIANRKLRAAIGSRINCMAMSYPYDGHWPLTKDEELTLRAETWMRENRSRYYALGVKGPASESDFIVLLSCFLRDQLNASGENAELVRQRDAAQKDRDSLMSALGWKVEAPVDGFILEDARMLRPEMAKARARVMELQSDAEWANYLAEDKPKEFAVKIFRLYKEQKQRAETAEAQRDEYKRKWNDVLEHEDKTLALARKLEAQLREKDSARAENSEEEKRRRHVYSETDARKSHKDR